VGHVGVRIGETPREPEIRQLDLPIRGDQEVVRLDVSMQHEVRVAEVDRSAEHAHPGLHVRGAVGYASVFDQLFEVAVGEILDHHVDGFVFGGEDVKEADDGRVGEFLQVLDLADRVDVEAFGALFGLGGDFEFLDRDEVVGVGAEVAPVDDREGAFAEFLACERRSMRARVVDGVENQGGDREVEGRWSRRKEQRGKKTRSTLDVFAGYLFVHLLSEIKFLLRL
jgi:hypothetical protein